MQSVIAHPKPGAKFSNNHFTFIIAVASTDVFCFHTQIKDPVMQQFATHQ
jgi:hypothetical protein